MREITDQGLRVEVSPGWECQIRSRTAGQALAGHSARVPPPPSGGAVLHLANFELPAEVGDFGGAAVERMRAPHLLVNLVEYDDASSGTALFAAEGLPVLGMHDFDPATMQRLIEGQSGAQRFFTARGRPFCLYVVLGSHRRRFRTMPVLAEALSRITIGDRPAERDAERFSR